MEIESLLPIGGPSINEVNKYIDKYKNDLIVRVVFPFLEVVAGLVIIEEDVRGMYQFYFKTLFLQS